jgi:flagellar protein FliO/FliZ
MNGIQPGWNALLWFGAVVAAIPLVLWLLRRSPLGAGLTGAGRGVVHGAPRPVSVLPLSAQHKLVTVEVGQGEDRLWLVLGMGPQGLRTLHTMNPGVAPVPLENAPPQAAFAQLLTRLRSGSLGDDAGANAGGGR